MKIGFVEIAYKQTHFAVNSHVKKAFADLRKYFRKYEMPNLGLLTTAALVPRDWEIKYIDSLIEEIDYNEEFDIVALGGMTKQAEDVYKVAQKFKKKGAYIVIGGIHATVLPGEVQKYADTVIVGEAEEIFPQFIEDYRNNKQKPYYESKGEVDMTKSPIPRFDLIGRKYRLYPLQTTRGCPRNCKFCASTRVFGKKYRHKDVDQVIEEIKFLKSGKNNPIVLFVDDNMFINRSFSRELAEKLIPLDIHWIAISDVSVGQDKDFLKLLYTAGCREIFLGFESLSAEAIAGIDAANWKSGRVHDYKTIVENIQGSGIRVFGSFMIGFDHNTKEDFQRIKNFVLDNKFFCNFTILTPVPGTELYEEHEKSGRILKNKSWKYYTFCDCVSRHPTLTADELERTIAGLLRAVFTKENHARIFSHFVEIIKNLEA